MQFPLTQNFKLTDSFIEKYKNIKPKFGFNGLGEFVYMRSYSRLKEDNKNEIWHETIRRVVEGIYSIQKQHIEDYKLGWNQAKAQKSAQEMYDRIFNFKMLPSGRALWGMGTSLIMEKGLTESLYSCSFLSSKNISENPGIFFSKVMDFLMCGIGVGSDVIGEGTIIIKESKQKENIFVIPDTREGWIESLNLLINSFFGEEKYSFDYSRIRPAGTPLKTFGGVSSGYKSLKELHDKLFEIYTKNIGNYISSRVIADTLNLIGKCVISGNVRRSAEIIFGFDTEEFLNLKNYKKNPERKNYGWSSNNSIFAKIGMNYSEIAKRISDNAEPGLYWLENAQKYGRMNGIDNKSKDHRVSGANPCLEITLEDGELCVSGETRILTKEGYPKIKNVVGKTLEIWNGFEWSSVTPNKTNNKAKLIRIYFSDGSYLDCTEYHKFSASAKTNKRYPKITFAKDLQINDVIERWKFDGVISGKKDDNSYEWGLFAGDGYLDGKKINVSIYGKKSKLETLSVKGKFGKPQIKKGYIDPSNKLYLKNILKDYDLAKKLNNKNIGIPEYFFSLDKKSTLNFIAGWIETDGSIQKNIGSQYYRIYGSEQKMRDLQLICRRVGLNNVTLTLFGKKGDITNLGKRNRDLYYITIPSYECVEIPTRFKKINEFGNKFRKNYAYIFSKPIDRSRRQKIIKIEKLEEAKTFCFSEEKRHTGVFGNVLTYQCNLVELFPTNHETLEDFETTIKYAYLFAKTITLTNTNWQDTNRVMMRNRRIGLSLTGIAQFISNKGLGELKKWMVRGYETAKKYDKIYSDWFAIPESIKITTVKPSGTLSLLAGVTPGIHYPESRYYIRRVQLSNISSFIKVLKKAHYKVEPAIGLENTTCTVEFPVSVGDNIRTINDISMWEQLNLASFVQKYWSDNAVSVTVTFKKEEAKDIENALNLFQFNLKGVSFLPKLEGGAYSQMPYEEITKEKYAELISKILPLSFNDVTLEESIDEKYCNNDTCLL